MALTVMIAALGTREEESSDVTNMRNALFSSVGNVSMRKILVVTSAYVRPSDRPSVQTLGEGEGSPKATRPGVGNAIFSWREIARCFWATGVKSHDHRRF